MARLTKSALLSSLSVIAALAPSASAIPTQNHKSKTFPPNNSVAFSLEWGDCPAEAVEAGIPDNVLCATYSVPINWDEPHGDHFDLGLVKLPATASNSTNSTTKIGSLFVNPGGPGGSGTSFVATIATLAAAGGLEAPAFQELFASFDWIGLDPRGVGFSSQVQCDMSIYTERVSLFPKTQEDFDKLQDKNKRLGESCLNATGPLLKHLDTISVAKDFEAVRIALDNKPFNFLGLSYGSQLGAQYAALFPDNIRTLVLDGITQHSQDEVANLLIEGSSYSVALTHFFKWAATDDSSALKGQDVEGFWTSLLANATETPIPAASCNGTLCRADVNAEEIRYAVQPSMAYAERADLGTASYAYLSSALYNASQGDATAFATSYDPSEIPGIAIACLDWTTTPTLTASLQKQVVGQQYTPLTLGASQTWAIQHQCIGWPAPVVNPPKALDVKTEATVLLVQSEADPETGYPWAVGMTKEIEKNVLVTRKGDGHTSFIRGGDTSEVIAQYLITGKAPEEGLFLDS